MIGDYRLIKNWVIMGTVYLPTTRLRQALKLRRGSIVRSVRRLSGKAASALNHPHIITIYDLGKRMVATSSRRNLLKSGPRRYVGNLN
jgi:hypothetical protein